jgi:phosphate starvation-inducible PhoH-like protein
MGELQIGTEVVGSNGKPTKVSGIYPLGEREVYRVSFRDKSFVDCTDDHLWRVIHNSGHYQTVETKKLMSSKSAWYIDAVSSPVEYNSYKKLLIDPYRLGVILGDGHISLKEVKVTSNDQEIFDSLGSDAGYSYSRGNTKTSSVKNCIADFRKYNLVGCKSHEKFVPEDYLFACPSDRLSLLQGLMDTDGWVQKGCAKFSTTSEKLASAVVDLTNSLGGVTFHSTRPIRKGANFIEHIVTVRLPENLPPFRLNRKLSKWNNQPTIKRHKLRRKIESVEIVGKDQMQCIRVEANDHLYVTNDYIVTHNTSDWGWTADKKRDFNKQLQIMLYKIFYCQKMGLDLKDIKCGFVLLKRKPNKEGSYCEFVPVSVGDKSKERALSIVNSMVNQVKQGRAVKNRWSCRFCRFANTQHCM